MYAKRYQKSIGHEVHAEIYSNASHRIYEVLDEVGYFDDVKEVK